MKKTIFSVILMTFALMLGSCGNSATPAPGTENDSTVVATDSVAVVDSLAVEADSTVVDSVIVAE